MRALGCGGCGPNVLTAGGKSRKSWRQVSLHGLERIRGSMDLRELRNAIGERFGFSGIPHFDCHHPPVTGRVIARKHKIYSTYIIAVFGWEIVAIAMP